MDQQGMSASRFGSQAANYLSSAVHASGVDSDRLKTLAGGRREAVKMRSRLVSEQRDGRALGNPMSGQSS
jgi:hypothetical protein